MINTLLEHVPIKMEVTEVEEEEVNERPAKDLNAGQMAKDDEHINETDEDLEDEEDDEEDDDEEEDDEEEESDTETDALEIEQEATMLISSDEEAELEAQRIRFPDLVEGKKTRRDSLKTSRSSSRNSQTSNNSSIKSVNKLKTPHENNKEEIQQKQRISPRLKLVENTITAENLQKEPHNNTNNNNSNSSSTNTIIEKKMQNKLQENNHKNNRSPTAEEINKTLELNKVNSSQTATLSIPPAKSRRGSNNSTCSIASTVGSDTSETESCGNIYVFNLQQKLIFNCEFCDLKYGDLENFGRHLHEAHKLFHFDEDPEKENAPRNVRKSNCNNAAKTNITSIKKEPLQCFDSTTMAPEPPVALPLSVLAEPLESCGNVFMLNHRKLFLVCGYCECKYANLDLFEKHLRQQHRIFEGCRNELNVVPKVEIKQEMFVISEVVGGKTSRAAPQAMVSIPAEIPLNISISPENEAATLAALDDTLDMEDISMEQPTTSTLTSNSTLANSIEAIITNENSNSNENDKDIQTSVAPKKARNKRRSSPLKPLVSPNKRPKRNTRNTTKVQEEANSTVVNIPEKIVPLETTQTMETENTIEAVKTIENEDNKSTSKNQEFTASKESENIIKVSKSNETIPPQPTEIKVNKKLTKATESKRTLSPEVIEVEKFTTESNKETEPEAEENKEAKKSTERRKTPSIEMTIDIKKSTSPETIETKKTTKIAQNKASTVVESKQPKESKKTTKAAEAKKPKESLEPSECKETTKTNAAITVVNDESKEYNLLTKSNETKRPETPAGNKRGRKSIKAQETKKQVIQETQETIAEDNRKHTKTEATAENKTTTKIQESNADTTVVENTATKTRRKSTRALDLAKPATPEPVAIVENQKSTKSEAATAQETKRPRKAIKVVEAEEKPVQEPAVDTEKPTKSEATTVQEAKRGRKSKVVETEEETITAQEPPAATKETGRKSNKPTEIKKLTKQEVTETELEPETSENEMQCDECDKKFTRRESLKIHKRVHTGEKPFQCDICQKSFRAKQNLTMHKKFHMGEASKNFECEHCDKKFLRNTDLKVHMRTHTGEKKFKCGICLQGYASKLNVQTHIERDHLPEDGVVGKPPRGKKKSGPNSKVLREELEYQKKIIHELQQAKIEKDINKTTLCAAPIALNVSEQLQTETLHYQQQQPDSEMQDLNADPVNDIIEQIQNEILLGEQQQTQQETAQVNAVTYIINTMSEPNEVLNLTNDTTKNTTLILETQSNELLNSPEDIKPTLMQVVKRYCCDQCNRSFKKHIRLVEHQRVHTGEKPFECDECGKQFRIRMRLSEHKLRHSKEKKFKCEVCNLGCCTKQDLNLHMRHHTNDRRFQCSMCPKAFVRSSDLKIHIRVHTGEKPFVCDICHKCFRANQNLSVHKKSHMGDASKTYQCEHCDKKFMRNIDRKVHMRTHTGEKPYKCEICQRGYSSRYNVRAHIERDHISAHNVGSPPKSKKRPGPKPKGLKAELEKQKKLIEELQNQLLQQIKTDEKIINCEEEILPHDTLQDSTITASTPLINSSSISHDPIQSAYDLLNKLKSASTTSKPLTLIPSPPPLKDIGSNPFTKAKKAATSTLLPLTITQKIEQHSPAPSTASSNTSLSCLSTPSPPKTTATKVVSQKTSLGIQQVSVTVSMQVENVTTATTPTTPEKENAGILTTSTTNDGTQTTTSSSSTSSVKKERKITSYFTVVGQKADV
ncbi:hypothetical protein FF38_03429 [Lucilia cuprina]|uniref:C2H2-type domain-containing protein n=1 Tax=Lucilia cuprina TaxID=7375 RepID=A0A0L0C914_LUCCU|nr:hypothetical protein FF38_03429 [Lucilia cuprina]